MNDMVTSFGVIDTGAVPTRKLSLDIDTGAVPTRKLSLDILSFNILELGKDFIYNLSFFVE